MKKITKKIISIVCVTSLFCAVNVEAFAGNVHTKIIDSNGKIVDVQEVSPVPIDQNVQFTNQSDVIETPEAVEVPELEIVSPRLVQVLLHTISVSNLGAGKLQTSPSSKPFKRSDLYNGAMRQLGTLTNSTTAIISVGTCFQGNGGFEPNNLAYFTSGKACAVSFPQSEFNSIYNYYSYIKNQASGTVSGTLYCYNAADY